MIGAFATRLNTRNLLCYLIRTARSATTDALRTMGSDQQRGGRTANAHLRWEAYQLVGGRGNEGLYVTQRGHRSACD
jgi:hypothetical protein